MRVSKEVMAENNSKIIKEASRLFREKGIDNTSVADVMGAAGLTHGGFYRHFQSKDELVAAAIKNAFNEIASVLEKGIAEQDAKQVVTDFVRRYLSEKHVSERGNGCPIAAFGADAGRESRVLKDAMTQGTQQLVNLLALGIEGKSDEKHAKATALLSVLVGALVLARSTKTRQTRVEILSSAYSLAKLRIED